MEVIKMFWSKSKVVVREYRSSKSFERDARSLARRGYVIQSTSQGSTHLNLGRTLGFAFATGGLSLLGGASWSKGKIIVTYVLK